MCECYQIGGRFIAEDPDCPVHGAAAVRERASKLLTPDEAVSILKELGIIGGDDIVEAMIAASQFTLDKLE